MMIRMDLGALRDGYEFEQRVAHLGYNRIQLDAGNLAYSWGYHWHMIVKALESGLTDQFEIANWCEVYVTPREDPYTR
jgi:hypothetical protein